MPYIINRTSGLAITTVQDGTINSAALDITLVGKNYPEASGKESYCRVLPIN